MYIREVVVRGALGKKDMKFAKQHFFEIVIDS